MWNKLTDRCHPFGLAPLLQCRLWTVILQMYMPNKIGFSDHKQDPESRNIQRFSPSCFCVTDGWLYSQHCIGPMSLSNISQVYFWSYCMISHYVVDRSWKNNCTGKTKTKATARCRLSMCQECLNIQSIGMTTLYLVRPDWANVHVKLAQWI